MLEHRLLKNILLFLLVTGGAKALASTTLLPEPQSVSYGNGAMPLGNLSVYIGPNAGPDIRFAVAELGRMVFEKTGKPIKKAATPSAATFSFFVTQKGRELPEASNMSVADDRENYTISISTAKVHVNAATSTGLYYAVQTIRQLVTKANGTTALPVVQISDSPKLKYRGVMMDFAHGGLLTVEEIKRQIDFLARWKTNQYYFYNEVSIELKGHPTVAFRAGYTQKQIREIIAYGKERHMDVIPFLNLYGHLHELLRNETYADLAIGRYGHELDPRKPEVNAMLSDWIRQYSELFPSPFIHVGFDETWETKRIADDQDIRINSEQLWLQQLSFVQNELKKYGRTVLAWTDMNNYYPEIIRKIPAEVVPVIWEYKPDTVEINRYLNPVLRERKPFFIQPAVSGWGHIYPDEDYTYDNIDLCLKAGIKNNTLGFIHSVWTDPVEPFVRASWLFMAYGCIGAWQGKVPEKAGFSRQYSEVMYPDIAAEMTETFDNLAKSGDYLDKCLGRNTAGMPRGTIIESWSNPFLAYYLKNTAEHADDFRSARKHSEKAQASLIAALAHCQAADTSMLNSLFTTARLISYSAMRFLWAKTICDRWNDAMLGKKKNDFVVYDITHLCHGLIIDTMDENGELKTDYTRSWQSEYMPYRMNTISGRFDVEFGLWQKLFLKVIDFRIENQPEHVATQRFEDLFKPDF